MNEAGAYSGPSWPLIADTASPPSDCRPVPPVTGQLTPFCTALPIRSYTRSRLSLRRVAWTSRDVQLFLGYSMKSLGSDRWLYSFQARFFFWAPGTPSINFSQSSARCWIDPSFGSCWRSGRAGLVSSTNPKVLRAQSVPKRVRGREDARRVATAGGISNLLNVLRNQRIHEIGRGDPICRVPGVALDARLK